MPFRKYAPLLIGIALPIATSLSIQALLVEGWFYVEKRRDVSNPTRHEHVYLTPTSSIVVTYIAAAFGLMGTCAVFVRMFEKKIKWMTRLIILGAFGQGFASLAAATTFAFWTMLNELDGYYTAGPFYIIICSLISLSIGALAAYHHHMNRTQIYSYMLYDLSTPQRQLIILFITSLAYSFVMGTSYAWLEGWQLEDGVYWCISTLATIGFGDLAPVTLIGKIALPPSALCGIGLLAANIYSIRQVVLELLTHRLAETYSKHFGIEQEFGSAGNVDQDFPGTTRNGGLAAEYDHRRASDPLAGGGSVPQDIRSQRTDGERWLNMAFSAPSTANIHQHLQHTNGPAGDYEPTQPAPHMHSDGYGLPVSRSYTTTVLDRARTMVISRGENLPQLTIVAGPHLRRRDIKKATQRTFRHHTSFAIVSVVVNMLFFGSMFSFFEGWNFIEGLYFTCVTLTTIGYGDYTLNAVQSRSIFVWFVYIGVASVTYMFSIMSERALDQWTVTVSKIEDRVDRYERKAALKKRYGKKKASRRNLEDVGKSQQYYDRETAQGATTEAVDTSSSEFYDSDAPLIPDHGELDYDTEGQQSPQFPMDSTPTADAPMVLDVEDIQPLEPPWSVSESPTRIEREGSPVSRGSSSRIRGLTGPEANQGQVRPIIRLEPSLNQSFVGASILGQNLKFSRSQTPEVDASGRRIPSVHFDIPEATSGDRQETRLLSGRRRLSQPTPPLRLPNRTSSTDESVPLLRQSST
ncbi:hypothetical protein BC832DRAFT_588711 [Gaertneriomyces semiglobifer]|nr:hypothetical protein BC832DRAFT_588711 [Gaertneriomyces semiglobifer]